jgi:hypothetical protein
VEEVNLTVVPKEFVAVMLDSKCLPTTESELRKTLELFEKTPRIGTGRLLSVRLPVPSWPDEFCPQHLTGPVTPIEQVWLPPLEICCSLKAPDTVAGEVPLLPQHWASPVERIAQVPKLPADIFIAPVMPGTKAGVKTFDKFCPQHRIEPLSVIAQECLLPNEMAFAVVIPLTRIGEVLRVEEALPSCPSDALPQHITDPLDRVAQVCSPPVETAVALEIPLTSTGVRLLVVLLEPS